MVNSGEMVDQVDILFLREALTLEVSLGSCLPQDPIF